ncbi:hypothetical protein HU200_065801 [Digitaria exilis]|uniref:Uncharacterized protein n=1 Tax=Digitaria exilis TaxID=1010633 RepID=A0A835DTG4_9POAL|nr:hypothetical protein HU200_065801 [Digitaria exilis]
MSGASMFDYFCSTHQFKLNYEETKNLAIGEDVLSGDISAGGHIWRVICFPRGEEDNKANWPNSEYLSIFLKLVSQAKDVQVIFEAFLMDRDGASPSSHTKRFVHVYKQEGSYGWPRFVERSVLEPRYVTSDGYVIITCGVKVVRNNPLDEAVPSDIGRHLGVLLDSKDGSNVSFIVGGEAFAAHRAVLAARSPVFKAQLLGSMADAKMPSITLQEIAPVTFKAMLRFMYTDVLPEGEKNDEVPTTEAFYQDLLAAADRFALERLKLLCAKRLWGDAHRWRCPELKEKCIDFFADEKNFKKAVLTDGFAQLVHKFPSILAELRDKTNDIKTEAGKRTMKPNPNRPLRPCNVLWEWSLLLVKERRLACRRRRSEFLAGG